MEQCKQDKHTTEQKQTSVSGFVTKTYGKEV